MNKLLTPFALIILFSLLFIHCAKTYKKEVETIASLEHEIDHIDLKIAELQKRVDTSTTHIESDSISILERRKSNLVHLFNQKKDDLESHYLRENPLRPEDKRRPSDSHPLQ